MRRPPKRRRAARESGPSTVSCGPEGTAEVWLKPPGPRQRHRSRSRHPSAAGHDNETLDHLLSNVVARREYRALRLRVQTPPEPGERNVAPLLLEKAKLCVLSSGEVF